MRRQIITPHVSQQIKKGCAPDRLSMPLAWENIIAAPDSIHLMKNFKRTAT